VCQCGRKTRLLFESRFFHLRKHSHRRHILACSYFHYFASFICHSLGASDLAPHSSGCGRLRCSFFSHPFILSFHTARCCDFARPGGATLYPWCTTYAKAPLPFGASLTQGHFSFILFLLGCSHAW
jgi:hypothetical protein